MRIDESQAAIVHSSLMDAERVLSAIRAVLWRAESELSGHRTDLVDAGRVIIHHTAPKTRREKISMGLCGDAISSGDAASPDRRPGSSRTSSGRNRAVARRTRKR